MNSLIEMYNELHPNGPTAKTTLLRENFTTEEAYKAKMDVIHEAINAATEAERTEFIEWAKDAHKGSY